jgi:hypothetical protein
MTYENFNEECIMQWGPVLEEFGRDLQCIKGERNVIAEALSRLKIDDDQEGFNISNCFHCNDNDLPPGHCPTRHEDVAKAQKENPALLSKLRNCSEATFCGGDKDHKLMCHDGKTALPPSVQQKTIGWFHKTLCHPGKARTKKTACQHFEWNGRRKRQCLPLARNANFAKRQR